MPYTTQNAVIVGGMADQVALAEMVVRDLDRRRREVVVDVIVMEVDRTKSRSLGITLVSSSTAGLNLKCLLDIEVCDVNQFVGDERLAQPGPIGRHLVQHGTPDVDLVGRGRRHEPQRW